MLDLLLLLLRFCSYFSFQILQFLLVGAQKYFLPHGAGYPSYATAEDERHLYNSEFS